MAAYAVTALGQFNQPLLSSAGVPAHIVTTTITAVSFCSSNSCSFQPGTTNAIGQATVTLSSGMFAGTFSMPTSGTATNPAGASCPNNSADFTISSSGLLSSTASSANQNYTVCIAASQAGLGAPDPYIQVVTLSPGTGIACDIGPAYTGQIPAGATRAGYTHCAVNLDFTQFTNVNQFIDCFGAATPLLYFDSTQSQQAPCTSTHFAMVSDGGSNALQTSLLGSEYPTYQQNWLLSWIKSGSTALRPYTGWTLPNGYYVELVWRLVSTATFGGRPGFFPLLYAPFFYSPAPEVCSGTGNWLESDFDEAYADLTTYHHNGPLIWSDCSAFPSGSGYQLVDQGFEIWPSAGCCLSPSPIPVFSNYYTRGLRLTADGSANAADCMYLDSGIVNGSQSASSQFGCLTTTGLPTTSSNLLWTSRVGLMFPLLGSANMFNQGWTSMTGNIVANTQRVTIWSCANWRDNNQTLDQGSLSNECYPGVLTGTP